MLHRKIFIVLVLVTRIRKQKDFLLPDGTSYSYFASHNLFIYCPLHQEVEKQIINGEWLHCKVIVVQGLLYCQTTALPAMCQLLLSG